MKLTDISKYDLIESTGFPKYQIELKTEELTLPVLMKVLDVFSFGNLKTINDNTFTIENGSSSGDFTKLSHSVRKNIFKALHSLSSEFSNILTFDLDFKEIPSLLDVIEKQYSQSKEALENIKVGSNLDNSYFFVFGLDKEVTRISIEGLSLDIREDHQKIFVNSKIEELNIDIYKHGTQNLKMDDNIYTILEYIIDERKRIYFNK